MSNRATLAELRRVVARYADILAAYGILTPAEAATVTVASPYGRVRYVVRDVTDSDGGRWIHDVPGFEGSGGSGFLTTREGIDRIRQSLRVLHETARRAGWMWDDAAVAAVTATVYGAVREGL